MGNKCDMGDERRAVSTAEGETLAKEYNIKFFETSAKQGLGVEEIFLSLAINVKARMINEGITGIIVSGGRHVVANNLNDSKKKGCC